MMGSNNKLYNAISQKKTSNSFNKNTSMKFMLVPKCYYSLHRGLVILFTRLYI